MRKKIFHALQGDYLEALAKFSEVGGTFFSASEAEGIHTIVSGNNVWRFFPRNSKTRGQLLSWGETLGIPSEKLGEFSKGKLAKYFCSEFLGFPEDMGYYSRNLRSLARKGHHWHYLHCNKGQYKEAFEIDLTSAYLETLFKQPTLFYDERRGWLDDGGAMERLKDYYSIMPKWFRLVLLGTIASHNFSFYTWEDKPQNTKLKYHSYEKITTGYAFNSVHLAIFHLYKFMEKLHKLGGESIIRIHTDSITFKIENDDDYYKALQIEEIIRDSGYNYKIKGGGSACFFDVNTGHIGNKILGSKKILITKCKNTGYKLFNNKLSAEKYAIIINNSQGMREDIFYYG